MNKLTDKEIYDLLQEVILSAGSSFFYSKEYNLIRLNGSFSSDELREVARVMDDVFKKSR